jgi:cytochrome c-type biogenesis protein CcmH
VSLLLVVIMAAAALACAALLYPLFRASPPPDPAAVDLAIYKDQLRELEREVERGLVPEAEARAARLEIERRILRLPVAEPVVAGSALSTRVLAATALLVPVLAAGLYAWLGSPGVPSQPFAERPRQEVTPVQLAELERTLLARTLQDPKDVAAWTTLGRVRAALGETDTAISAFRTALELAPGEPMARLGLAETLVRAAGGMVGPEAAELFDKLAAAGQGGPRVDYYRGLHLVQAGDAPGAIARWREALALTPPDVPLHDELVRQIREAAPVAGVDPDKALADLPQPPAAPGPSPADVAAAGRMAPDDRQAMIRGMVERLEARLQEDGSDADGWVRLGRSRLVLGEPDKAAQAFAKAAALRPDDPAIALGEGEARLGAADPKSGLPRIDDQALDAFRRAERLAPDDPQVNWYLGIRAVQDGDRAGAKARWSKVLAALPAEDPNRPQIQALIDALGS